VISIGEALVQLWHHHRRAREDALNKIQARQGRSQAARQLRLIRKLGEGGMGAVYLAEDTMMRRPWRSNCCWTSTPTTNASGAYSGAKFARSGTSTIKTSSWPIRSARNSDAIFRDGICDGEPLDAKLKRAGRLPKKKRSSITSRSRTLAACARTRLHSPRHQTGNIFITRDGAAKILDMGLSKDVVIDAESSFNTQSGVTLGTPHYVSPEQAEGRRDLDGRTDIYSLGSTLFHLVVGRRPTAARRYRSSHPRSQKARHRTRAK